MINPTTTLNNPYYFFNNNVLYNISNSNTEDEAGEHLVTYELTPDVLSKDDEYLDAHGDVQVVPPDGGEPIDGQEDKYLISIKTNTLNDEECAKTFPHFVVNYETIPEDEESMTQQIHVYYWLQSLINDGDTVVDNDGAKKFVQRGEVSYIQQFNNSVEEELNELIQNSMTLDNIKKRIPIYCFDPGEEGIETTISVDGKQTKVKYVGTTLDVPTTTEATESEVTLESTSEPTESIVHFTDNEILESCYNAINDKLVAYCDNLLAKYGKELQKPEQEDQCVKLLVDNSNIEIVDKTTE